MSDDTKSSEGTTSQVDTSEKQTKQWTDEEVQKIISERDKSKNKLRNLEEASKKLEEQKLIEDGKLKELLAVRDTQISELQVKANQYDEDFKRLKEQSLNKIENEDLRNIVSKLNSIDDIAKIVELTQQKNQIKIDNSKTTLKTPERKFKNFSEMEQYLKSQNLAI